LKGKAVDFDLSQYMSLYIEGSKENLDMMDKCLLELEQNPNNLETIGEIFRGAHTLKGMSATMGFEKIAHLTHEMENILDKLRNRQLAISPGLIDLLFETFDILRILVNDSISATDSNIDLEAIVKKLSDAARNKPIEKKDGETKLKASPIATSVAAPAAPAAPAPQKVEDDDLADMVLNEFENQVLLEASQKGANIVLIKVFLVKDCLLKAPRAFMVTRNLEELSCEIIKSVPETKDLEQEKFDLSFKMVLVAPVKPEEIKADI